MKKLLMMVTLTFLVSACSEEVKSIDYYKEHTTERLKMLEECEQVFVARIFAEEIIRLIKNEIF